MPCVLGIDTSAYTTSLALIDASGEVREARRLLRVKEGARGLRQSEAVFEHVKQLPELFQKLFHEYNETLLAVCASNAPRHVEGSYMPVFCVGASFGQSLATAMGVPCFFCSHQQGHLMAAWHPHRDTLKNGFLALHISGGTTELLQTTIVDENFDVRLVGKTLDLHAGQLIDRIGVALGGPFPSGPQMEALADDAGPGIPRFKTHNKGADVNLSGLEQQALRAMGKYSAPEIAAAVYDALAKTLARAIEAAAQSAEFDDILIFGGVASSARLRRLLGEYVRGVKLYFGSPQHSGDNAVGVARIGKTMYDVYSKIND